MSRSLASRCVLLVVGCAALGCTSPAQRVESLSQGAAMRQVYAPVVQRARLSVVEVAVDGAVRLLGTVVAEDLVVTKFSELPSPAPGAAAGDPELTCLQGEHKWVCRQLAFDRPADLVLLRVSGARLTPIEWQSSVPTAGAFLATPGTGKLPLGVGMLAAAPYLHTQQRAFLGIQFANSNSGPAELGDTVAHGAAEAAGMQRGDVVVGFAKHAIRNAQELRVRLRDRKPGDKVEVKVRRAEAELSFEVTLGTNNSPQPSDQERIWGSLSKVRSGFRDVLQHDTVLEPGDCGGPVVDLSGKAVGVNIARAGRVETLALPAAEVRRLVASMLRSHEQATGR